MSRHKNVRAAVSLCWKMPGIRVLGLNKEMQFLCLLWTKKKELYQKLGSLPSVSFHLCTRVYEEKNIKVIF